MPTDKPKISLNLDTLEREGATDEPFVVVLDGHPITFKDPGEIDWQDLMQVLSDPRSLFKHALSTDDAKRFLDKKLPSWKLGRLVTDYREHYGVPDVGNLGASSAL